MMPGRQAGVLWDDISTFSRVTARTIYAAVIPQSPAKDAKDCIDLQSQVRFDILYPYDSYVIPTREHI